MLYALTVGRNEQHRYLASMLAHTRAIVDAYFFFDDGSDDRTALIASEFDCLVAQRHPSVPSFEENEGAFRGAAWKLMEKAFAPEEGDWVLVVDCDEFLVAQTGAEPAIVRHQINADIGRAAGLGAIDLAIPEVFGFAVDDVPLVRKDRLWGTIHAPRLCRFQKGGAYPMLGYGVPAVPSYVMTRPWANSTSLALMHYGYARRSDQRSKYERYIGRTGHSNQHVESILSLDARVERWMWPHVKLSAS